MTSFMLQKKNDSKIPPSTHLLRRPVQLHSLTRPNRRLLATTAGTGSRAGFHSPVQTCLTSEKPSLAHCHLAATRRGRHIIRSLSAIPSNPALPPPLWGAQNTVLRNSGDWLHIFGADWRVNVRTVGFSWDN
jgi:hypothetical protein